MDAAKRADGNCLVFDLDGTLSDPLVGIARSMNHALETHGFEPVDDGIVSAAIGPPLDVTFRQLVRDCDDSLLASLVGRYRERYAELGYGRTGSTTAAI